MTVVLATGLTGFLGKRCLDAFRDNGLEIHGVTSRDPSTLASDVRWHRCDLLKGRDVEKLCASVSPDVLFHLAWFAEHPAFWSSPLNRDWLRASIALVDAFAASGGSRVVVAGSCAEYGPPALGRYTERSAIAPSTPYGSAKAELYEHLREIADGGFSSVWGRLFFLYGPGEPSGKFIPSTADRLRAGMAAATRDPKRRVDYIHVRDAARALVKLINAPLHGAVNIGTGQGVSMGRLARIVEDVLAGTEVVSVDESKPVFNGNDMVADVSRLRDELGFRWDFDIVSGVRDELGPLA